MKANPRILSPRRGALLPGALALALAGCAAPPPPVAPPPPPPAPAPPPRPVASAPVDWRDAPLAPGAWALSILGPVSTARYGGAITIACRHHGAVDITLPGPATSPAPHFTIITSSRSADLTGAGTGPNDGPPVLTLAARDPLLDAIAFSRGRFVVEAEGRARLILPADPAISRVVEDCRAPR